MIGEVRQFGVFSLALSVIFGAVAPIRGEDSSDLSRVAWSSTGIYRVLVKVDPQKIGERNSDESVAQVSLDFVKLLESVGVKGKPDMRTVQVIQFDPKTGRQGEFYQDFAYQRGPWDRPFRWYDDAIPYDFQEVLGASSHTDGVRKRQTTPRAGYVYNAVGDWKSGKLAWTHTQTGDEPTYYAIYFDVMDTDTPPPEGAPVGWLGDAMPRCARWGANTTGADITRITLDDWNKDGLTDVVYGEQYGQAFYALNNGTKEKFQLGPSKMLFESDGLPMDMGMHSAPLVIDWDGDGDKDLLIGTYENRIGFFRNTGTNTDRVFKYEGYLRTPEGEFLALPVTPVANKEPGVFKRDYFPMMCAVDWDADDDLDLLAGGYITGRVYFLRNTGQRNEGLPVLDLVGPVEADGKAISVRDWCAAPTVADFNGDGLLDMAVGAFTWKQDSTERPNFIRYYVNCGTAAEPKLTEQPLPVKGDVPNLRLPSPQALDANGDGLIDLLVASGLDILLYPNVGTKTEPLFDLDVKPLRTAWGNAPVNVDHQIIDWNYDGLPDIVAGYTVYLNSGIGKPYFWERTESVLPKGARIDHPAELGDGHFYPYLHDVDHDGKFDVLFGDWHGHVWFHRNWSKGDEKKFDMEGVQLETTDGKPIQVGPIDADTGNNFQALQGARTTLNSGDYNGDGLEDLVVGDTYGKIRYYENVGELAAPKFKPPVLVGDLKSRLHVEKGDWNCDGKLDVIAALSSHKIYVFLNEADAGGSRFGEPMLLDVAVKNPIAMLVDLNRDGDDDLVVNGTQGTSFVERSYLERGYAPAQVLKVESKSKE